MFTGIFVRARLIPAGSAFDVFHCLDETEYSPWSRWGECSESYCGGGTMQRIKKCLKIETCGDVPYVVDEAPCNEQPCQVDGSKGHLILCNISFLLIILLRHSLDSFGSPL